MKVKIPQTLVDRVESLGPHFCLVDGKNPNVSGKGWQKRENLKFADNPRLQEWLTKGGNYGVVGGYGLLIIDIDHQELKDVASEKLPRTFKVLSPGHQGWHLYFLCSLERGIRLRDKEGENIGDMQGPGKMVVGPNSVHPNGGVYKVIDDHDFAQVTRTELIEAFGEYVVPDQEISRVHATAIAEKQEKNIDLSILNVVPLTKLHRQGEEYFGSHPVHGSESGRNFWVNPARNCWHCFRHGSGGGPLLWLAVEEGIIDCEEAGPGALRGEAFKKVVKKAIECKLIQPSEYSKDLLMERKRKPSQADRLIHLCLEQELTLFHDQHEKCYVRIKQDNINVTLPLRSKPFKSWLSNLLWQREEKAPGSEALTGAINVLSAKALFNGKKHVLYNRVAPADDGIWVDMADENWRAIKITAEGWRIVDDPPILFKRYSHQKPLAEPKPGGDPRKFLDLVNIDKEDENTRLLLLCTVISYLIPLIPHVIVVLHGIQGSGKTCLFKVIRCLIDPSAVDVLTLPRDERERVQQLAHHWLAFYDNVTSLPTWMSDTLCRAATGGGFTKRELYTDDSDIIYNFKRCVGINGINIAAQRGDLLDRSLLVGLSDIPHGRRKTEEFLLKQLEKCKGEILGGFLDTLVKAIRAYPTIKPETLFRMADFTKWGCAIAVALGYAQDDFIKAYEAKVKVQIEEAAHASPLATVLLDYMQTHENWDDTPSKLFTALLNHAKELGISTRQKAWPKAPHVLIRQLNELIPSLKALGWEVVTGLKSGGTRRLRINRGDSVPSDPSDTDSDSRDARDASFPSSSRQLHAIEDLVSVRRTDDQITPRECGVCGYVKKTNCTGITNKNDETWLCEFCYDLAVKTQREV